MKLVTWNVNGFRAAVKKDFLEFFKQMDADFFCIQETKLQLDQIEVEFEGYYSYWNSAVKKGYSGTAVFAKKEPINVTYDIGIPEHDNEGRVITLEYDAFFLVNVYTPNAQRELARLAYRMEWEDAFRDYLNVLDKSKPVIFCGDLNVAHKEIDLENPKTNHFSAGFSDEERQKMTDLLESGFTDSFRFLYPDRKSIYTWWSYMFKAREKNVGWRIDYFLVSNRIKEQIKECEILDKVMGSDHCPVVLDINIEYISG